MNELLVILRYRRLGLNIILILLTLAASFYTIWAVAVFFILTSNLFDLLGYYFTLTRKENKLPGKEIVRAYRIIQFMFDIILLLLLGITFGWIFSLSGAILKLFAIQDLLYYFFLNEKLPERWNWLGFTPLGWFKTILNRKEVMIQAIFGILLAFVLLYYI